MCRMYGESSGIKLSFRVMCIDTFVRTSSSRGSVEHVRNIATLGHSRIITDTEWSFKIWGYVQTTLDHMYIEEDGSQLLQVHHHTFSKGKTRIGALGRKLLMSTILYDPYSMVDAALLNIFKQAVSASLKNKKIIFDEQILESFYRVERYSETFKRTILQKISLARSLL